MKAEKYAYQRTQYQNIFKETYWGHHVAANEDKDIIDARNSFVVEYDIQKTVNPPYYCSMYPNFDHVEFYRCKGGEAIIVNSPYIGATQRTDVDSVMDKLGFLKAEKMYDKSANTYIKHFSGVREMNIWLRTAGSRVSLSA